MILSFLRRHIYQILLVLLVAVICLTTYKSGTFLSGWDTLHPEFNFSRNLERMFNGVWREDQGLGAVAGHSHMADLPRVLLLWILNFALPLNALRYSYVFVCLLFGPLGMFYLLKHIFSTGHFEQREKSSEALSLDPSLALGMTKGAIRMTAFAAFLGSVFYLFNPGTAQQFYAPFEMFTTQYAVLPWIVLFSLQYLESRTKDRGIEAREERRNQLSKDTKSMPNFFSRIYSYRPSSKPLLFYSLVTLLATPQSYAAHLWYAFFGVYVLFLIVYALLNRHSDPDTTSGEESSAVLPSVARSFTSVQHDKKTSGITKRTATLILLTLLINSFWLLPNLYYIATSSSVPKDSKQNRIFSQEYRVRNQENGYLQDVALVRGFYFQWSVFNVEKNRFEYLMPEWRYHLSNPGVASIGYALFTLSLLGAYLSLKHKNRVLISLIPFYILPFTLLMNSTPPFSWLFNLLLKFSVFEEALRFIFTKVSILFVFGYVVFFSYAIVWIASKVKRNQMHSIFLALLVAVCIYGLPLLRGSLISDRFKVEIPAQYFELWSFMESQPAQPVLTLPLHTFSGWQYYDWATPTGGQGYQGSGLIWFGMKQPVLDRDSDRWSVANEQSFRELQYTLYSKHPDQFYHMLKKYGVGFIVWDTSVITPTEKNRNQILYQRETTEAITDLTRAGKLKKIKQLNSISVYKVLAPSKPAVLQISTQASPSYRWNFVDQAYLDHGNYITSDRTLTQTFTYPFRNFLTTTDRLRPELAGSISDLKHAIVFSAERMIKNQTVPNVVTLKKGEAKPIIEFRTKNFTRGMALQNDTFPHNLGYIIGFRSRNVKGLPLRFCLKNLYSSLCNTYDELSRSPTMTNDYFVIPPYESGRGYGLYLDNISYGNYETINELESITVYPLFYNYLARQSDVSGERRELTILHNGSAYNAGWIAFALKHGTWNVELLKQHVLVNNWENGWIVPTDLRTKNYELRTIFWPQYLEYLGFLLLLLTIVVLSFNREKKPSN